MFLLLLVFAGPASAGPVQGADTEGVDTVAPEGLNQPIIEGKAPRLIAGPVMQVASAPADSSPSASALAAEIISEAQAGAQALEQPSSTKRAAAQTPSPAAVPKHPVGSQAGTDDDPWGLRQMGKAAVHWIKDTVPWLRSDEDDTSADQIRMPEDTDWSASPTDRNPSRAGARAVSTSLAETSRGAPVDPTLAVGYGPNAPAAVVDPDQNIVRVVIRAIREVLEHPMTWLVVSLFVIGGIVVKKIDRRPTK